MRVRKNDKVKVIAGNDRGRVGQVLKVLPDKHQIIVEKVNMIKRHTRRSQQLPQGGIIEKEGPIDASNVVLVCPKCGEPARTGRVGVKDGQRTRHVRSCKSCGEMLAD